MVKIVAEIRIERHVEIVFDAARSVEMHLAAEKGTYERAVGGKTNGLLELGDTITFEGVHFGVKQRLTSEIVEFDRPRRFVDRMVRGAFRSLEHTHDFFPDDNSCRMRDTIVFEAPFGFIGRLVESAVLRNYMYRFIVRHQMELKRLVEQKYDPEPR